jgi:diphosphomevalonate decarboxylase
MNPTSHEVSALIHQLNSLTGRSVAAYTFDAGPNACLFLLDKVSFSHSRDSQNFYSRL